MKKYKLALFIGRFQPFHRGHLFSLKKARELASEVIVGIGSSEKKGTEDNPWSYREREEMVKRILNSEQRTMNGEERGVEIVAIPDTPGDEEWVKFVEQRIMNNEYRKTEVVIVGNNEWVNGLMEGEGYPVYRTGLYNRYELEGVKIRKLIRKGGETWKARVPKEVVELID